MSFCGSQNSLTEDDQLVPGSIVRKLPYDALSSPSHLARNTSGSSEAYKSLAHFENPALKMSDSGLCEISEAKRRMLLDAANASNISSRSESPLSFSSSRSQTPTGTLTRADRTNELWKAIGSIDSFLMDKDILEACQSTADDLTCDMDDFVGNPNVSFAEFLQQYQELNDWLNQLHKVTQREVTSFSEKYLNQSYHEEILERSPRREFLNNYSRQLLLRYPNMAEQITSRMSRLNTQWSKLEQAIAPKHGQHDAETMLQDLECDLDSLRRWLNATESRLLSLTIKADWTNEELEERLLQHQALQKEIESRNKIVNAVLKLSERLEHHSQSKESLKQIALGLERRWHGIWLQSLEWQYRLEEALSKGKGFDLKRLDLSGISLPILDESLFSQISPNISDSGLIELDDDSLLFIGGREDYADSSTGIPYKSFDLTPHSQSLESISFNLNESIENFSQSLLLEEDLLQSEESSSKASTEPSSPSRPLGFLKPDSPLGKRPFPGPRSGESSPAKKGSQSPSSSSGGLSPIAQESPLESFIVSRGYQLHSKDSLLINSRDEFTNLKLRKNLFDRSSGDSANISETESKMGDSPPVHSLGHKGYVVTSSDGEVDTPAFRRLISTEVKDIGYSSESQSNDEVEVMGHQIDMEYKFPGKCELATDGPLGEKISIPSTAVNTDYYFMTHVDVDSTDKTDNGDTTDSGAEKVVSKNLLKKSMLQNGYLSDNKPETAVREVMSQSDSFEASVNEVLLELEGSNESNHLEEAWDTVDAPMTLNGIYEEKDRFCVYFPCEEDKTMLPMHHYIEYSESDSAPEYTEKKSIKYLIDHAEDLVKQSSPQHLSKSLSPKKQQLPAVAHPSPSKQTQTDCCSTVESSCDASGEDNSDHEGVKKPSSAPEDFSTATEDADETLFNSVINLDSAKNASADDVIKTISGGGSPVMDAARLRKQTGERKPHGRGKKDRPWSVVGLQEYTTHKSKTDSCLHQVVAASESAIDHLNFSTDTDSPFHTKYHTSTFPRDKHSFKPCSYSEQPTSSQRSSQRKSSYSSSLQKEDVFFPSSEVSSSGLLCGSQSSSPTRTLSNQNDLSSSDRSPSKNCRSRRLRKRSSLEKPSIMTSLSKTSTTDSYDSAEAESESETSDDYLTAPMEQATSDGDDVHNISGSLSEHSAWDNYQALYPTASEDPGEELLNWEEPQDELEFDDDFQLSRQRGSIIKSVMAPKRSKMKFTKQGMPGDDSDSDLEDFHHILEQSELSLRLADQSLRKRRRDPMGTGLHPDPAKYEEIIVTYDTNIVCLKNVLAHLKSEDISQQDVARVNGIMSQWEKLYMLASERLQQTTQLGIVRHRLNEIQSHIKQSETCAPGDRFNSSDELRAAILSLRVRNETLVSHAELLKDVTLMLQEFAACHPAICLDKYHQEIAALKEDVHNTAHMVSERLNILSNNCEVWQDYLDNQKELDSLLAHDRDRLHSLLCQREFGMKLTKKDVLIELEKLQSNLSLYESKLSLLQAMRARLIKSSDNGAQRTLLAALADLRNQLLVVSERCQKVYRDVEEDEDLPVDHHTDIGKLAVVAASLHEALKNPQGKKLLGEISDGLSSSVVSSSPCISKTCASWLRSLPVQVVALMLVAGLVCVLDPELIDRLTSFTMTVTPELQYVNGPPSM
ncbi:uncharacterized protein LOC106057114 isoform X2 [Biomphalaria glabrata]|nr:uncharacterized protein LOC106057114 isoform X2 [Biomphalaria glabrata]XP_055879634.1 uncharacterized protein LOC106057114 isoform X2 [Biomphalaria glabrata]XP_055879635.1 uncharacterized protein LOC106057114 isoform X2 [Biomphalaria glabrata]